MGAGMNTTDEACQQARGALRGEVTKMCGMTADTGEIPRGGAAVAKSRTNKAGKDGKETAEKGRTTATRNSKEKRVKSAMQIMIMTCRTGEAGATDVA